MKFKLFIPFLFALCCGFNTNAQIASESKVRVEFVNGYWLIDFKADNQSAMKVLKAVDPTFDPSSLGVEGVEKKYRAYLKKRFKLQVDSNLLEVKFVSAEMNSVRANVQFISKRFDDPGQKVWITSTAFSEIDHHQQKLIFLIGEHKQVSILSSENEFSKLIEIHEADINPK